MTKKASAKPILELHDYVLLLCKIEPAYKAADSHSIFWDNVKDLDKAKIYEMLLPPVSNVSILEDADYDYVHSQLKKTDC